MSIPSDFDPLAWDERRYIQPILKYAGGDKGVTNESYPYTFKMEVDGTSNSGRPVPNPFGADRNYGWGAYSSGYYYCIMTFEKPLRIVGMRMLLRTSFRGPIKLYGIVEGQNPLSEGVLLGEF